MSAAFKVLCRNTVERRDGTIAPCGRRARWRVTTDIPVGWMNVCGRHVDFWVARGNVAVPIDKNGAFTSAGTP